MTNKTLCDCVEAAKTIHEVLSNKGFDAPEKAIIAMYLEEAARAECREIEELERMVK